MKTDAELIQRAHKVLPRAEAHVAATLQNAIARLHLIPGDKDARNALQMWANAVLYTKHVKTYGRD